PIGTCLAPKTGTEAAMVDWQRLRTEYFFRVEIRDRYFGRGNGIQCILGHVIGLIDKLWELPGSSHRLRIYKKWRKDFCVPVRARVQVEHEINKCSFQLRAAAHIHRKSGSSDLRATFEIEQSMPFREG